jgi:hypothetical protein
VKTGSELRTRLQITKPSLTRAFFNAIDRFASQKVSGNGTISPVLTQTHKSTL